MGKQPCPERVGLKRGTWTMEEDSKLINFILNNGIQCWRLVPKHAGLKRCGKSCRLRWINYLRPDLKRGAFTQAEEDAIIQLHSQLGNRWSKIAAHFPGRTDNEIKNHWNTRIKKKLKLLGLDPLTHKPVDEKPQTSATEDEQVCQKLEFQETALISSLENNQIDQKRTEGPLINCSNQDKSDSCTDTFELGFQNKECPGSSSMDLYQNWMNDAFVWDWFTNWDDNFP